MKNLRPNKNQSNKYSVTETNIIHKSSLIFIFVLK